MGDISAAQRGAPEEETLPFAPDRA